MTRSRLFPLLAMLALLLSPFGRMAAAETMAVAGHHAVAAGGHCEDMPAPAGEEPGPFAAIDCALACAAATSPAAPAIAAAPRAIQARAAAPVAIFSGVNPEADPPPPRLS